MSQLANNLRIQDIDAPPPPYSETDISAGPCSADTTHDAAAGDVIYTPPLTSHTPSNLHISSSQLNTQPSPQPQSEPEPGAALYFESRSPPATPPDVRSSNVVVVVTVKVEGTSLPDDFPYQNHWAARDVTGQDWATFVNYLLPDHTLRGNQAVLERKLRAEGGGGGGGGVAGSASGRSQAEAQFEQLRGGQAAMTKRSRREVEATIQQWNDGFFGPRGINVRLDPGTGPRMMRMMPGAWQPEGEPRDDLATSFGNVSIDGDGIRHGDHAVARDRNDISIGRQGNASVQHEIQRHRDLRDCQRDFSNSVQRPAEPSCSLERGRGRHPYPCHKEKRERSYSAVSVSSVDSSSSESSIGSLPNYDDVKDHQLPLYAQRLQDWTSDPARMHTKSDVRALKAELDSIAPTSSSSTFHIQAEDKKALKAQIKSLQAKWRSIKRAQRQTRKAHRRERRQQRRAERREQRHQRRERRRDHKDDNNNNNSKGRWRPLDMPGLPMPPILPVPVGVAAPPVPPASMAAPAPSCPSLSWSHGFGRGHRSPAQCNPLFFGPDGPVDAEAASGLRGAWGPQGPFGRGGFTWGGPRRRGRGAPFARNGGYFGGGRGRGNARDPPGAWPWPQDDGQETGVTASLSEPPSAAKYKAAERMEAEIERMASQAAGAGDGAQKWAMDKAIEGMTEGVDRLRMEADEQLAMEVASRQGKK